MVQLHEAYDLLCDALANVVPMIVETVNCSYFVLFTTL